MRFWEVPYKYAVRSIVIDGLRIAYIDTDFGTGDPVVFLHGVGANLDWFVDACERILPERRVIAIDLVGFGKSDKPRLDDAVPFYVTLLARFLDTLEIDRVTIVGHSMGAQVAALFAIEYPLRVERLVLASPAGVREVPLEARASILDFWSYARVQNMNDDERRAWCEAQVVGWNDRLEASLQIQCELAKDLYHREWARAVEAAIASVLEHPIGDRFAQISAPTLVIAGLDDRVMPFTMAVEASEKIPGAVLVGLSGCGHLPMFEQPEEFTAAVYEFVTSGTVSGRAPSARLHRTRDVEPWPGLTVEVGRLAKMLFEQRDLCVEAAAGLSVDDVAWNPVPGSASIGEALFRLAGSAAWYLHEMLVGEPISEEHATKLMIDPANMGAELKAPRKSAERLVTEVEAAHARLEEWLQGQTDATLNRVYTHRRTGEAGTLRWVLWHLIEEATAARGRITCIREQLGR